MAPSQPPSAFAPGAISTFVSTAVLLVNSTSETNNTSVLDIPPPIKLVIQANALAAFIIILVATFVTLLGRKLVWLYIMAVGYLLLLVAVVMSFVAFGYGVQFTH